LLAPNPTLSLCAAQGAIAQLGERLLCKQEVVGSIPSGSTSLCSLRELRLGKPVETKAAAAKLEERSRERERQRNQPSAKQTQFRMHHFVMKWHA
jgi:hypothetical protein